MAHHTMSGSSTSELRITRLLKEIRKAMLYLQLYAFEDILKDHSDNERRNSLLTLHGLLFSITSKVSFICTIPQTELHILLYTSRGALARTRNRSMGPP